MAKPKSAALRWLEGALAFGILAVLRRSPERLAFPLARAVTSVLDRSVRKLRRAGRINLSFAFPELSEPDREKLITGVFDSLARLLVSFARFPDLNRNNIHRYIRYEGLENYKAAKAEGRGVLVATAHLGNWELSAFSHALMTEPMDVMVRPLDNPFVDRIVERRRQLSGNRLLLKKDSALGVVRALKSNRAVGMLIDQNTSVDEGVFVDFFGRKACANAAFARLAARTGAVVIPGFALWHNAENKYVLRFYPPIPITGDTQVDTQRIHSEFERLIRQYPDQWMWIHRRWKTRPPGEEPLY